MTSTISTELLLKYHKPTPRYTSYPTAPEWEPLKPASYETKLKQFADSHSPLSLYVHIPFCKSMCLFCGCSVVLNRKQEKEEEYVRYLQKELSLLSQWLKKTKIHQLHFGGGTPTKLSIPLLELLWKSLNETFSIDLSKEIAIEVDPRTVIEDGGEKLRLLRSLGFNRISFGVQDTNPQVQEAIKRRQTKEMSQKTYFLARELGFRGINLDLIYGLPFQTLASFQETIDDILQLRPDRIALFSYAKVPWLKPHQKAIPEETLPSTEEKFKIYAYARKRLIEDGYLAIGMDHFCLEEDELALCYRTKTLQRNFQGYSSLLAEDQIGIGMSSIGYLQQGYFQNAKELKSYYGLLDTNVLPIQRGKILSKEDLLRKWTIHTLMCSFELSKSQFEGIFCVPFDTHFAACLPHLTHLEEEGLLCNQKDKLSVTPLGELFIRNIAVLFDAYYPIEIPQQRFSNSI